MSMNLRQARQELLASVEAGNSVLMVSPSGIGKSQLQLSIFNEIKQRDAAKGIRWGLGIVFAATQCPPDLIGFQFKGEREYVIGQDAEGKDIVRKITITDPSIPLWMLSVPHGDDPGGKPAFLYDRFFLIIEEYGQGEADVKRAMAEIFLNGGTAPWYLPPGSIRVASSNEGSRYGVTKDFDFCIARRTLINIHGDIDVWLDDFADKPYIYQGKQWQTMAVTKAWARQNPSVVFEKEPEKQGPWCNPRTLCAFDRYLQVKKQLNGGKLDPNDGGLIDVGNGTIGGPATMSYVGNLQFALELPTYQEVVSDPDNTPVPTKPDLLMLMAYQLAEWAQPEHIGECITYVQRMKQKDMSITFVSSIVRRNYDAFINLPAMQAWLNKNAALMSIIVSLSR